ncbi:Upstream stimulatory factor 1 [Dipsacomyces acuminosporus]|nr:Upstream stimulatory factor 1 [Dipsacomyces acuminosporus]
MSVPSPYHHPHMHSSRQTVSASSSPVAGPGTSHMFPANRPLTAEEKELKRKVSHSAIEKRRRERTNAVLRELQTIVPGLCKPGKIQKLEILEATAEYIRQLSTVASIRQHQRQRQQRQQQQQQRQPYSLHLYPQVQPQTQYRQPRQLNSTCPPELASVECTGSDSGKAENEDRQNLAIATPKSVSSNTLSEDSADDGPASESSTLPPDPSSINFLLC